jgi:hypothetical protein
LDFVRKLMAGEYERFDPRGHRCACPQLDTEGAPGVGSIWHCPICGREWEVISLPERRRFRFRYRHVWVPASRHEPTGRR